MLIKEEQYSPLPLFWVKYYTECVKGAYESQQCYTDRKRKGASALAVAISTADRFSRMSSKNPSQPIQVTVLTVQVMYYSDSSSTYLIPYLFNTIVSDTG